MLEKQKKAYMSIGAGALNSAIIGAIIEVSRATMLQAPNTVELYKMGKYS